jgi:hypothetical protein
MEPGKDGRLIAGAAALTMAIVVAAMAMALVNFGGGFAHTLHIQAAPMAAAAVSQPVAGVH